MNPFTVLGAKIFGGIALALLLFAGIQQWRIGNLKAEIKVQRNLLAECNAARAVQNAAIERQRQEGERQRQAYAEAQERGQQIIRDAQPKITVVRQTPRNGCTTPQSIREAGL